MSETVVKSSTGTVEREDRGRVAILRLRRDGKANAWGPDMAEALVERLAELADDEAIGDALSFHGIPPEIRDAIVETSLPLSAQGRSAALAAALASLYRFEPLKQRRRRAVMLVGPPGSGKTATAAKLAARSVLADEPVRLITTDTVRAGGTAQLEALAKILRAPFHVADGPARLADALAAADPAESVVIDTGGVNPFNAADRRELAAVIKGGQAEPVLVFAAGGDANDSVAMAEVFRSLGCARAIVTRLDTVRRLGSVLAVAHAPGLALADAGIAPDIADGLVPFTPVLLARLLLPKGEA